ncbi:MAG: hypothetical protein HYT87_02260 [Nitrospirae bacterium]|nr:hypothetical protein [Nitrospirota bacterium]
MSKDFDRAALRSIVRSQAYPPYAGYPGFRSRPELLKHFLASWVGERIYGESFLSSALGVHQNARVLALAEKDALPSRSFGFPMARATLWGAPDERAAKRALRNLARRAAQARIRHLSCRVDARETAWRRALLSQGFYAVDTLVSYVAGRTRRSPRSIRWGVRTRTADRRDEPAIVRIARSAFVWDRFHSDPHLPVSGSNALYAEWARLCCRKVLADHVRVGVRGGRVAGFVAHRLFSDLERLTGLRMYGQGLGAGRPGCGDVYMAAVTDEIRGVWDHMDLIEIETQAQNHSHLRLLTRLGFAPMRTSMTYHRWLWS